MVLFNYSPKHKDVLPSWDNFQLVIPFTKDAAGFTGLNIHCLPPILRLKLLARLDGLKISTKNNDKRLLLQWKYLKNVSKYPEVAPCVKRYLWNHCRSKFMLIPYESWVICSQLPVQKFVGMKDTFVWTESRRSIYGNNR
jgi:hypothetical protein